MQPTLGHAREATQRYVGWRARCLLAAGFEPRAARRLARDARVDLHALLELIDRGCPPALAERITAPLEPNEAP
jgi:hypothetical protein